MVPSSATRLLIRPAESSTPRAAQFCKMTPPCCCTPLAITGTAMHGSAVPSDGENTPPFQDLPVVAPRAVASALSSIWVMTPSPLAKSRHLA